jgi:spore maturation protein SpmA
MTPLESTIALCELGLMVCAAFLLGYAIRYWVHLLRVSTDLELVTTFNRFCRRQTRKVLREITLLNGKEIG